MLQGRISVYGRSVRTTRTALLLRDSLPYESWREVGVHIGTVANGGCWWVGDWLLYGQREYPGRYRHAIEATGLDYQTLRNYAWVAGAIGPSRRRDTVSFGHHAEVASLSVEEQDAWLDVVEAQALSRNELRRRIQVARVRDRRLVTLALAIAPDRHERWLAAASAEHCSFRDWIEGVLDHAAESALGAGAVDPQPDTGAPSVLVSAA